MTDHTAVNQATALLAIVVGVLACFWGYRILKFLLGILGFIIGSAAGWQLGLSVAPGNPIIPLVFGAVAGILGGLLCVWFFFLGVFLLGASAGAVLAATLFGVAVNQVLPTAIIAFSVIFGVLALLVQRFMIILSTSISGAYLVMAGLLHFATSHSNSFLGSIGGSPFGLKGVVGYIAFAFWLILGLAGIRCQLRNGRKKEAPPVEKA